MKIKTPIEFMAFNDGVVDFYETDENDEIISNTQLQSRFHAKKIGVNRYYAARSNDIELSKLIAIHRNDCITTAFAAVIDKTRYKIEQISTNTSTNPPTTELSLSQRGLYEGAADND